MRMQKNDGSIVLEATLTLPFFALLLLAAISFLQIGAAELALRSAVSEMVKTVASNMYPVDLVYTEAKQRAANNKAVETWSRVSGRVLAARGQLQNAERLIEDYAAYIPEPLLNLAEAEKQIRERLEEAAAERADSAKQAAVRALTKTIFTPLLRQYTHSPFLEMDRLEVISVELPIPDNPEKPWFGMEVQYEMRLALPMFGKTVQLRKRALERCWIGN